MIELSSHYPLGPHNSFGIDVKARWACTVEAVEQLDELRRRGEFLASPCLVLGGGSNVVLTHDFSGLVLLIGLQGRALLRESADAWWIEASAGESWREFVAWTVSQGWGGLENLAWIPGTVGAAPIQNIGAYGLEMAEYFDSLTAFEISTGQIHRFDATSCAFGYRDSFFKQAGAGRFIILSVRFRLPKDWTARVGYAELARHLAAARIVNPTAQQVYDSVVAIRQAKLPDPERLGNVGSFFKNPVVDAARHALLIAQEPDLVAYPQTDGGFKLAAGWLIDRCGWKGRSQGAAAVHDRQALVLVNRGGASGAQVMALAEAIQGDVARRFGVSLEIEPRVV